MVPLSSLWLPILVAAVVVFAVSSIMHMFLGYHWNDLRPAPQQDALLDTLRGMNIPPGDYALPKADSMQHMRSAEYVEKVNKGPLVVLTMAPGGMAMGKSLTQWFIYLLLVGVFCAYIAGRELAPGASYLAVFRIVGFTAFVAYAMALPQASIWYRRNWRMTLTGMFDGLVFGLLTAGIFGWLWPK
jgi:hypothetical protein